MTDKNKTGGSAFPRLEKWTADGKGAACNTGYYATEFEGGMTLRDYFAAQSIAGINPGRLYGDDNIETLAEQAYKLADAMLKAREK